MEKCDVIIPVYNAPDYTKLCLYTLFKNTENDTLNKVYLLNDNSNEMTHNLLENLAEKYSDKVVLIHNKENLGFIKNVNHGMQMSESNFVLLLNTDCLIGYHTIEKLMDHMQKDKKIGLICPVSSNAVNLTLPMFPGFSYMMMDRLLGKKFEGMNFDACTVVGNCLMISKSCIKKVGYFDEIYGMGYCDETDYQFQAMEKGFKAKVAIDCYVFHKAEMSFNTTNQSRNERLERNRKIFFARWGDAYDELLKKYEENDPIKYINSHITEKDKVINYDYMFVCPQNSSSAGGVKVIIDLVNYLTINGLNIGLLNLRPGDYNEIILFNIATVLDIPNIKAKYLLATIFDSVYFTRKMADKIGAKLIYFSQGYEFVFENGIHYGKVEVSFKLVDYVLTVSNYLKEVYKELLEVESTAIVNGIDLDLALSKPTENRRTIAMILRNEPRKADYMVLDIIKHITAKFDNVEINLMINNKTAALPVNNNEKVKINKFYGPLSRNEIYEILRRSDIFIDTSLSEGFGLMPLEAMANSVVPIISNSFGINDFAHDQKDSIIIQNVNNPYAYISAIEDLLSDDQKLTKMKKNAYANAKKFDFDTVIDNYLKYFKEVENGAIQPTEQSISLKEMELLSNYVYSDQKYKDEINNSSYELKNFKNRNSTEPARQTRLQRIIIVLKEFFKANFFLLKMLIKSIFKKDFRI